MRAFTRVNDNYLSSFIFVIKLVFALFLDLRHSTFKNCVLHV